MKKLGLLIGGIALVGLVLLTVLPIMLSHPDDSSTTCLAICLASDTILGRAGFLPQIMTAAIAGVLVGALYVKSRRKETIKADETAAELCQYCGTQIHDQWLVCPFCGQSTFVGTS